MISANTSESSIRKQATSEENLTILLIVTFAIMTAAGAHIRIPLPFTPVPITLQTFFVLLGAGVLGPRLGTASMTLYAALGIAGLPFFTNGNGPMYLTGPTGGYIVGFIAAQAVSGQRHSHPLASLAAIWSGALLILLFGWTNLVLVCGMSPLTAFSAGVLPFIAGDTVKAIAAAIISDRITYTSSRP